MTKLYKMLKKQWIYAIPIAVSAIVGIRKGYDPDVYDKYVSLWLILTGMFAFACVGLSSRRVFSPVFEKAAKIVCLFIPFAVCTIDMDTFWIVSVGRNILKYGFDKVDRINFYHFHSIAQQWLTAVTFAGIDHIAGMRGLMVFTALIGFLFTAVTYQTVRDIKIPWTITLCVMVVYMHYLSSRPFMISALLLAVEYLEYRRKRYWLIPVTGILFINVHMALWPMEILLLGTLLVESLFERTLSIEKVVCVGLIIPASLLNPYGVEGFIYPFHILSKNLSYISEMASPVKYFSVGSITFALEVLFIVQGAFTTIRQKKKFRIGPLIALAGTLGMTLTAGRHIVLTCIPLPYVLGNFATGEQPPRKDMVGQVMAGFALLCLCVVSFTDMKNNVEVPYKKAFDVLDRQPKGVLYTGMDPGGYASYRGYHPYMDARTEPHYKIYNGKFDWWDEYIMSMGNAKTIINKYKFDYVLCVNNVDFSMQKEMKRMHSKVLYRDSRCTLYRCTPGEKAGNLKGKAGAKIPELK